jgi:hypothetical protein
MVKSGLDLNLASSIRGISNPIARTANEHGQTCFCASDVAPAADHFPQMCRSLQRRAQGQTLHDEISSLTDPKPEPKLF